MSGIIADAPEIVTELAPTIARFVRFTAPIVKRVLKFAYNWLRNHWNTPERVAGTAIGTSGTVPHSHGGGTAPRPTGRGGIGTAPFVSQKRARIRTSSRRRKKEYLSIPVRRRYSNTYRKR